MIGVGAAACAACCAGPILGVLAAIGLTTAAGIAIFGVAGLAIASLVIPAIVRRRRRSAITCTPITVAVDPPSLKPGSSLTDATLK